MLCKVRNDSKRTVCISSKSSGIWGFHIRSLRVAIAIVTRCKKSFLHNKKSSDKKWASPWICFGKAPRDSAVTLCVKSIGSWRRSRTLVKRIAREARGRVIDHKPSSDRTSRQHKRSESAPASLRYSWAFIMISISAGDQTSFQPAAAIEFQWQVMCKSSLSSTNLNLSQGLRNDTWITPGPAASNQTESSDK